jgi:hypothetical protein
MSYDFNGTTAYAQGATPLTASPLTIIAWMKGDAQAANRGLCCLLNSGATTDYYYLRVGATDIVEAITRDAGGITATAATTATITESSWQFIHGTWATSGASRRAGINAGDYVNDATSNEPSPAPDQAWIGGRALGPTDPYDGKIALVAVYNEALSDAELTELYTTQPESASSYSKCVAYWDFRADEGTTTVPNAKNPGTYDMTLYGTTKPTYDADNPTLGTGTTKYLKLLVHPDAIGATNVQGVAWTASGIAGTEYGEFTGQDIVEGTGDDDGYGVLLVPAADCGCSGLAAATTVRVYIKDTVVGYQTGVHDGTIVEV